MVSVKLDISKGITHLGGNELGRCICLSQVLHYLKKDEGVEIEMPEHIDGVAIGFIQGIRAILMTYDENIEVKFKAKDKKLADKILKDYNY